MTGDFLLFSETCLTMRLSNYFMASTSSSN